METPKETTQTICIDTSVLINLFRKQNKEKSYFYQLLKQNYSFAMSVVTEYEIMIGSNESQIVFWKELFAEITILPFDRDVEHLAVDIFRSLKRANKLIDVPDIFIAATAMYHKMPLATINRKHFERIENLILLDKPLQINL